MSQSEQNSSAWVIRAARQIADRTSGAEEDEIAAIIDREMAQEQADQELPEIPCCPIHESMLREGRLPQPLDNCVVCIRNERDEVKAQVAKLRKADSAEGGGTATTEQAVKRMTLSAPKVGDC